MNQSRNFFLLLIGVLCIATGCSHSIKIDIVRKSSDLAHCQIAFGNDLNTLTQENAILLQIGVIDTSEEYPVIPVAIVVIEKKEIILHQKNHNDAGNEITMIYDGEGYKLTLTYKKETTEHNESIYKGKFLIERKSLKSEYDVVGTVCHL